jgi:hypothetical protein
MKNKILTLLLCLHCLACAAAAQNSEKRQVVLRVSNGGFIAFKSETSASDNKHVADSQSLASLIHFQTLADENRIIHRVLADADHRIIFGYDLWVNADPMTRKFSLAVMPADDTFRRTFLKESTRTSDLFATFPKAAKPQTLDDGDAVSLQLLVNTASGVSIVDVVRVAFDRSMLRDDEFGTPPKDFTLDAVSLSVRSYHLLIDGVEVGKGKSTVGCTGSLLWFYVPDRGRFIFSLLPREGYSFHKIGVVDGNRIEFTINGENFEWVSSEPILASGGTWNLWVLLDESYSPLFGPDKPPPKDKGPNVLEKLGVHIGAGTANNSTSLSARPPVPTEVSRSQNQTIVPVRVMVGGADSMDHLLPKAP